MKHFIKHFANATLIGILLYVVFLAIYFFNGRTIEVNGAFWKEILEHMIFSWLIYLANAVLIAYLIHRYGMRIFKGNILFLSFLGNIAVSVIAIFLARIIVISGLQGLAFSEFISGESPQYYIVSLVIAVCITGIFYSVFYYKHRQDTKVKEQKINVLTSLIEEDPDQAQRFTTGLSKVYRYVLEQKNKELVSVDEEFAFARTYVRLLKMRFEEGIVFDIPEKSIHPEARIVPLSLQLLLENAVKHNVVTPERPLHIRVTEQDGYIIVSNNLQPKQVIAKSSGVGLQNIRQRYALLTERNLSIEEDSESFRVGVPVLTRQISVLPRQEEYLEDKRYLKAKEKVEAIKGFYGNLLAYCLVIPMLVWLNSRTTSFPWAIFPAIGWGFGLVMHGMEAYGYNPLWGRRWEERKIRELMNRDDF
jgi:hypothetical protein